MQHFSELLKQSEEIPEKERQQFWNKKVAETTEVLYAKCGVNIQK
jgi:hypothetical protein